jgi:hypothetical protein
VGTACVLLLSNTCGHGVHAALKATHVGATCVLHFRLDKDLGYGLEVECKVKVGDIENFEEVKAQMRQALEALRDTPSRYARHNTGTCMRLTAGMRLPAGLRELAARADCRLKHKVGQSMHTSSQA